MRVNPYWLQGIYPTKYIVTERKNNMYKIFLACPISKYLDGNEFTDNNFRTFITDVYDLCKRYSDNVFFSLKREDFGKERMEDDVCTPLDYVGIKECDLVIAIPEDSMGVAVELGWASASNKDIILVLDDNYSYSPLVKALGTVTSCDIIDLKENLGYYSTRKKILNRIEQRLAARAPRISVL